MITQEQDITQWMLDVREEAQEKARIRRAKEANKHERQSGLLATILELERSVQIATLAR